MSTHTPGPWSVEIDHLTQVHEFIRAYQEGEMFDIASLSDDTKDIEANARLIAAAPDLLAALDDLLSYLEGYDHDYPEAAPKFDRARAAIAKAQGVTA